MCPTGFLTLDQTINNIANLGGTFFEKVTDKLTMDSIRDWVISLNGTDLGCTVSDCVSWLISSDVTSYVLFIKERSLFLVPFVDACSKDFLALDYNASVELFKLLLGI